MAMAISSTAAVTVSSFGEIAGIGSGAALPSQSSLVCVRKNGVRKSMVASYGIPSYGAPRPYQTPGADYHTGARPVETSGKAGFGDVSRVDLQWNYGTPSDYSTPVNYQTPRRYGAPHAYGPGVETTELGQEGVTLEDVKEAELDGGDVGGGGGRGDENGGSGGGRGDDGGEGEKPKKKAGMSMSQKLTLAYAVLVGVGGLMGFAKSGSSKSLMAGGGSASILYYVFLNLPSNPVLASAIGLGISGMLLFIMGSRYMESGKVFPAGVVSLFSLVMAGGYIHGIMRSAH
ncbi:hypothetical protein KC19_3G222600 [Ceratodon purpureus]|uniref:Uncharacterized protein n=1 Tax=Ceratodon purpureus TaxID=3225 RepID=A0A8T0ILG0_CERPU|nr:hypothetical protein KC19_3G222600 [Ceratodon purpureus]